MNARTHARMNGRMNARRMHTHRHTDSVFGWHGVFVALAPPRPGRRLLDLGRWSVVLSFTDNESHDDIRQRAQIHWRHFQYLNEYCGF